MSHGGSRPMLTLKTHTERITIGRPHQFLSPGSKSFQVSPTQPCSTPAPLTYAGWLQPHGAGRGRGFAFLVDSASPNLA